jgi:hypothetical protein
MIPSLIGARHSSKLSSRLRQESAWPKLSRIVDFLGEEACRQGASPAESRLELIVFSGTPSMNC